MSRSPDSHIADFQISATGMLSTSSAPMPAVAPVLNRWPLPPMKLRTIAIGA